MSGFGIGEAFAFVVSVMSSASGVAGQALAHHMPLAAVRLIGRPRKEVARDSPISGVRRGILDVVTSNPGISISELISRIGKGSGTIYHHVAVLESAGLVVTRSIRRRRLVFPAQSMIEDVKQERLVLLLNETARRVASAVLARPGCSVADVQAEIGDSIRVVYHHMKRLRDAGLLVTGSGLRRIYFRPSPELAQLLELSRGGTRTVPDKNSVRVVEDPSGASSRAPPEISMEVRRSPRKP